MVIHGPAIYTLSSTTPPLHVYLDSEVGKESPYMVESETHGLVLIGLVFAWKYARWTVDSTRTFI
jgi:hypothetical protein